MSELQARMSSAEFSEWMAFDRLEPLGERQPADRHGILAALIANANRDPKKQKKAFKPQDFTPDYESAWTTDNDQPAQMAMQKAQQLKDLFGALADRSRNPT